MLNAAALGNADIKILHIAVCREMKHDILHSGNLESGDRLVMIAERRHESIVIDVFRSAFNINIERARAGSRKMAHICHRGHLRIDRNILRIGRKTKPSARRIRRKCRNGRACRCRNILRDTPVMIKLARAKKSENIENPVSRFAVICIFGTNFAFKTKISLHIKLRFL